MSKPITVMFEMKSYTFDGKYWYGTVDYMVPTRSVICSLTALIPAIRIRKTRKPPQSKP